MATALKLSTNTTNAQADALSDLLDGGTLEIYTGSAPIAQGTDPGQINGAPVGTLLAVLTFASPSAPAASAGVLTFNSMTPEDVVLATGTAGWFRCIKAAGGSSNVVLVGNVGATGSGSDLELSTTSLTPAYAVVVSSFTYTVNGS